MKTIIFCLLLVVSLIFTSCESAQEKKTRLQKEEQQRIELAENRRIEESQRVAKEARERIARESQIEEKRKEMEIHDKYINNSLLNGSTPYSYCYGGNGYCSENGCSKIKVRTPSNSDVLVTIKRNGNVVRHAYIAAASSFTFEFANGTYQAYFYYGKGWNPEKVMKKTTCGELKGGFITEEQFGKDDPRSLSDEILTYELILQQNGNFSTSPSNQEDAL